VNGQPDNSGLIKTTLIGVALVGLLVAAALWFNRGSNVRLEGRILKVRAIATGEEASLALVDFRIQNPAKVRFLVQEVRLSVTRENGEVVEGLVSAQSDLDRVLQYFPAEGPRYNEVLRPKSNIGGGAQSDWCVGAGWDFPARILEGRKNLTVTIEDVDGAVVVLQER
jgi:hypothetical protein